MKKRIVAIILTYNSQKNIKETILSAKKISQDVIIVDSYSKDKTIKIVKRLNCRVIRRKFKNYSDQRNFIIKKCDKIYEWQLHLDADEVLSSEAIKNIKTIIKTNDSNHSYLIKRQVYFMNTKLVFGGASNWHLRLFPSKNTQCENKLYDQHFVSKLGSKKIKGVLNDKNNQSLYDWINSHNNWSSLAVKKQVKSKNLLKANFFGDSIQRNRFIRNFLSIFPIGIKGFLYFFIKYIILLGFLHGRAGFIFYFLNSFWFQTLCDAKKYELTLNKNNKK